MFVTYYSKWPNNLDSLVDIFLPRNRDHVRLIASRVRHKLIVDALAMLPPGQQDTFQYARAD